jgi:two-component system, NarL family, sensor histidine kinase DesK
VTSLREVSSTTDPIGREKVPLGPSPGRLGPWMASIWLVFLVEPLTAAWSRLPSARGIVGVACTVAFGLAYLWLWVRLRRDRARLMPRPTWLVSLAWMSVLVALAVGAVLAVGQSGTATSVYCAVTAVMLFPTRVAIVLVLMDAALNMVLANVVEGWTGAGWLAFSILAASLAVWGILSMMRRTNDLLLAHEENAALAVENERTRFARDLHDILGHSLTVITVKAELANRLLDVDTERARAELVDLERLSRDALADVRRAVEGYRELTLPGELTRARTALAAADIRAEVPGAADEVPSELRELFAWTVREGVTNVIRHSGASRCQVVLSPTSVEVRDDGVGPVIADQSGSGLIGLRERAAAHGARVITTDLQPGYSLQVVQA